MKTFLPSSPLSLPAWDRTVSYAHGGKASAPSSISLSPPCGRMMHSCIPHSIHETQLLALLGFMVFTALHPFIHPSCLTLESHAPCLIYFGTSTSFYFYKHFLLNGGGRWRDSRFCIFVVGFLLSGGCTPPTFFLSLHLISTSLAGLSHACLIWVVMPPYPHPFSPAPIRTSLPTTYSIPK